MASNALLSASPRAFFETSRMLRSAFSCPKHFRFRERLTEASAIRRSDERRSPRPELGKVGCPYRTTVALPLVYRLVCSPGTNQDIKHSKCARAQRVSCQSFNARLRDELLNGEILYSLAEARVIIEAWRRDYNESRPHMALNGLSPSEFARKTRSCEEGSVQMAVEF